MFFVPLADNESECASVPDIQSHGLPTALDTIAGYHGTDPEPVPESWLSTADSVNRPLYLQGRKTR
jgi:hypothetical protein